MSVPDYREPVEGEGPHQGETEEEHQMPDGVQTHDDIPEIPEGVQLPDSTGSLTPDVEEPEPVDYSDVGVPASYPSDKAEAEGSA